LKDLESFSYEGKALLSTWILKIAIRLAINYSTRRWAWAPQDEIEQLPAPGCTEEVTSNRQLCDIVAKAMDSLPAEQRALLSLAADDVAHAEIAEILGIYVVGTVRTQLFRARNDLRRKLSQCAK
jgi:RNA polymerase sigma-70 factor (ECF subfamily)